MANGSEIAPYGSWKSPITSDLIVSGSVGLIQLSIDGDDIYWLEMRPTEGGRNVIVKRQPSGLLSDVNPQPFNARTRAHEYGGGDYVADRGTVYYSNFVDQRLTARRRAASHSQLRLSRRCVMRTPVLTRKERN